VDKPRVLLFYGVGGAGKTWLLKKLRAQVPAGIPFAHLDFDVAAGGRRFLLDPATALQSIRQQLGAPTPRFDTALNVLREMQGHPAEPGLFVDVVAEVVGSHVPIMFPLRRIGQRILSRILEGTALEEWLASLTGSQFALELRSKTDQEIGNELYRYLAADLREFFTVHLNRTVRCVIFLDTFDAIGTGFQNEEHRRLQEKWIRDLVEEFDFALTVIAGQNQLYWERAEPEWADRLQSHQVGGLSEGDARIYLTGCKICSPALQDSILATSRESSGGYHCFSLGLCADIVLNERKTGQEPHPDTLQLKPRDWEKLADRFLRSLASNAERRWIERLALTPRFDEAAARRAFSPERSVAQDAAWESLHDYSFVERVSDEDWSSIREEMRSALNNQPSARHRVNKDHQLWKDFWSGRSQTGVDSAAGLGWIHHYRLAPSEAMNAWNKLAECARTAVPPRMREHFSLLQWVEPLGLLESPPSSAAEARTLRDFGNELCKASWSRGTCLQKAISCYQLALSIYTEQAFSGDWAETQDNLGTAWRDLSTGDHAANLGRAIGCFQAALRIFVEQEFPQKWARSQNDLGRVWLRLPTADRAANLEKAIACFEAALKVRTEQESPRDWATTQNDLGAAWSAMPTGNRTVNLERAIACYEAALRVRTEQEFPQEWAITQNNLGIAWRTLPTGDRAANLGKAIACYEAALRVLTEEEFPWAWAMVQAGLGAAWDERCEGSRAENVEKAIEYYKAASRMLTEEEFPRDWAMVKIGLGAAWCHRHEGSHTENVGKAIACYEAALRVCTEKDLPQPWAMAQNNLGGAWYDLYTGNRAENVAKAIACYEAALRVRTEQEFPQNWANLQYNLGKAWDDLPTGDPAANMKKAVACYEAALRVFTESGFPREHELAKGGLASAQATLADLQKGANSNPS